MLHGYLLYVQFDSIAAGRGSLGLPICISCVLSFTRTIDLPADASTNVSPCEATSTEAACTTPIASAMYEQVRRQTDFIARPESNCLHCRQSGPGPTSGKWDSPRTNCADR